MSRVSQFVIVVILLVASAEPAPAQVGEWSAGFQLSPVVMDGETAMVTHTNSRVMHDSGFGFAVDLAYRFTEELAVELALMPSWHDLEIEGGLFGGRTAGDEWVAPLALTVVYHAPLVGRVQPYVGAGVNYAAFLGYSRSPEMTAIGVVDVETTADVGLVAQAGVDFDLNDRWSVCFDLKYLDLSGTTDVVLDLLPDYASVDYDGRQFHVGFGIDYRFGYRN